MRAVMTDPLPAIAEKLARRSSDAEALVADLQRVLDEGCDLGAVERAIEYLRRLRSQPLPGLSSAEREALLNGAGRLSDGEAVTARDEFDAAILRKLAKGET
jgi:hypothetical protein